MVLLAGCGGSGRLSQAEFRSQANAVCKRANDQLASLPSARTFEAVAPTVDRLTRIANGELSDLKKLKPPKADELKLELFLNDLRSGVAKLPELKAAAQARDRARARSVLREIASNPSDKDAQALGLSECARNPSSPG